VHERGYRISEWLHWRWETVQLQEAMAKILLSKPTRWVEFDLSPQAVAVMAGMPAMTEGLVFPWRNRTNVYNAVDKIAPKGVHWRPHESRRAVVTAIIRNTGDPAVARDHVGHASIKTTLWYRVVEAEDVRPAVRKQR
jgi:integrase